MYIQDDGNVIKGRVSSKYDPYDATAIMIVECAIQQLKRDKNNDFIEFDGGCLTPATHFGTELILPLIKKGINFEIYE